MYKHFTCLLFFVFAIVIVNAQDAVIPLDTGYDNIVSQTSPEGFDTLKVKITKAKYRHHNETRIIFYAHFDAQVLHIASGTDKVFMINVSFTEMHEPKAFFEFLAPNSTYTQSEAFMADIELDFSMESFLFVVKDRKLYKVISEDRTRFIEPPQIKGSSFSVEDYGAFQPQSSTSGF